MDKKSVSVEQGLLGKVTRLSELIEYQEASVVSRTLIKGQSGTVTLFAFDKDQALSEHTAPFDALVGVIDGEVEVMISNEPHVLNKGQIIIMPANKPHALRALTKFKMILTMIRS